MHITTIVVSAAATLMLPSILHAQTLPSCPAYPNNDSIAYNTCGVAPSKTNYSNALSDLVIQSTDSQKVIQITAIPALAGAVASIKIAGTEIIATGGHGSSFQFDAHPVFPNFPAGVCNNPTEAGSAEDPPSTPSSTEPWLTPSSSLVETYWSGKTSGGLPQIATKIKMAYYFPEGYDEGGTDCSSYAASSGGPISGIPSPYELTHWLTLGATVNGTYYSSVLTVDSSLSIPNSAATITSTDLQMPMYLQNMFTTQIYYDPVDNVEVVRSSGQPNTLSYSPELRIFSNSARTYAVGVMVYEGNSDPKEKGTHPYTYTETQADTKSQEYKFRLIVPVHQYLGINPGDVLSSHSYFIFGSVALVEGISVQFCKQWKLCS